MIKLRKKISSNLSLSRGQTLVELLTALAIAVIVIVAIIALSTKALSNINFSRNQSDANHYANELSEWMRSERDTSWSSFSSRTGTRCFRTLSWGGGGNCSSGDVISGTQLLRSATLTLGGAQNDEMTISITVSWTDNQGTHSTNLNTKLTKWK